MPALLQTFRRLLLNGHLISWACRDSKELSSMLVTLLTSLSQMRHYDIGIVYAAQNQK